MALTFKQQRDQVLDITRSAVFSDATRVGDVINDVYFDTVQQLLLPIKSSAATTLVNGQADYDLSAAPFSLTDFIAVRDVIYNQSGVGPNNTLTQLTPHEIYQMRNQSYSGWISAFAIQGDDLLMLAPAATTGDKITLVYNYRPAAMVADGDVPALLPPEDTDCLIAGAAWKVCRWKAPERAAELELEYGRLLGKAIARQNRKGGAGSQKMQLTTRRRPPHDPSTDTGW